jgi:hypothetical protein
MTREDRDLDDREDEGENKDDKEKDDIDKEYDKIKNYQDHRYFDVDVKMKHLFFGYRPREWDFDQSESDNIISDLNVDAHVDLTMYTMTLNNMLDRILHEMEKDQVSDYDKIEMTDVISVIFRDIAKDVSKISSSHEIDLQDELRNNLCKALCSENYHISKNHRSLVLEYCIRGCPVVRRHKSPPIFVVEHSSAEGWKLTSYHPEAASHRMFAGVPVMVKSVCGLEYHVTVLNERPEHAQVDYV